MWSYAAAYSLRCNVPWLRAAVAVRRLGQVSTLSVMYRDTLHVARCHGSVSLDPHPTSTATVMQQGRQEEESDFVNIDALAAVGSSVSAAVMACSHGGAAAATIAGDTPGVIRAAEVADGVRYSRLGIPLSGPEAEAGGDGALRPNSRAVREKGARVEDGDGTAASGALTASQAPATRGATVDGHDELPVASALPYDDERFAEMVLRMEVEGAIDETWQDAHKACLEDVQELTSVLQSMRVRDVVCIDVTAKTSNFDYMLFGTCEGGRHIHLAAWAVQEADTLHRIAKVRRKQVDELWEVVPVGRIVVNLMVESLREELTLERKWAVTANMDPLAVANAPVSEGRQVRAHGLWTLTVNLQDLEDFEVDYCKDVLLQQR